MGAIRFFLACSVLLGHFRATALFPLNINPDPWFTYSTFGINAGYAVMYFYMISGFLMSYTITHNHASDGLSGYYKSRFIRIFSLYWPMYLIAIAIALPASHTVAATATGVFLFGSDWFASFARYPDQDFSNFPRFINQSWSLGAEVTFYAFAPLIVRSLSASICVLILSLATRLSFVEVFGFHATWTYHFFPSTVLFFVLGHLVRYAGERWNVSRWLGIPLLAASFATSAWGIQHQAWDNPNFYVAVLLFACSLPGIFELTKNTRWMNQVGNLSYPMYLTHKLTLFACYQGLPIVGTTLAKIDRLPLPGLISTSAIVVLSTLVSLAAHHWLERPTARIMRRVLGLVNSGRVAQSIKLVSDPRP